MTTQNLRLKLTRVNALKLKAVPRFPVSIKVDDFLTLTKLAGIYTFGVDYRLLDPAAFSDPANTFVAVRDAVSGSYKTISLSTLVSGTTGIDQHIQAAGPVTVLNNAGIVRVDQAVGAAITLTMPLASAKTCPVIIQDWKGDAGTNNITINLSGSDTFPGALTSWTLAADNSSLRLSPVSGAGYVIG